MAETAVPRAVGGVRNIIVLGKTGCGKSTLANKIICSSEGNETFKVERAYHSVTNKIESSIEFVQIGQETYTINMIDTIGLCDTGSEKSKTDSSILSEIKINMKDRAREGISLIIFVFRNGRFSEEERKVFTILDQNFKDYIKELSCLVITGCDGLNEQAREKLISDFKTDELTKKFAAIMTQGIFAVGFPKLSDLGTRAKEAAILQMQDDIAPIHSLIVKSKKMHLHDEIQSNALWEKLYSYSFCAIL